MARQHLSISDYLRDSSLQVWLLCKIWACSHVTTPPDPVHFGFHNSCTWTPKFSQETEDLLGIFAFLTAGWSCTYACSSLHLHSYWSSHISQSVISCSIFFYLKYWNHRALKLSSSCTLELKRVPWRNSQTAAELMLTGAWGLLANTSRWGADKPGRVSESKGGVAGEHYLI